MNDAIAILVAFVLGCVVTYYALKRTVGGRMYRDGYLHGFNLAWDEKAKVEDEARAQRLKKLRKTGPKLFVVKGDKQ